MGHLWQPPSAFQRSKAPFEVCKPVRGLCRNAYFIAWFSGLLKCNPQSNERMREQRRGTEEEVKDVLEEVSWGKHRGKQRRKGYFPPSMPIPFSSEAFGGEDVLMSGLRREQDTAVSVWCHRAKDVKIWCASEHEDLRPAHHLEGALLQQWFILQ